MSFSIVLYNNTSQMNVIKKSITQLSTVTGVLKETTSILKPTILIESTSFDVSNTNYAYISQFGRYYYITDIRSTANGLWEVDMSVDVLMTYKNQILVQSAIIARSSSNYNMYLDDGWFMAYQKELIEYKYLSNATPFETMSYVLTAAGNT